MDKQPPAELAPAWIVGDYDFAAMVCEDHAREFASERGLIWEYPGSTGESADGYAYAVVYGGDYESDTPNTCAGCDIYLDTALTLDGAEYVRETYPPAWWHLWGVESAGVIL